MFVIIGVLMRYVGMAEGAFSARLLNVAREAVEAVFVVGNYLWVSRLLVPGLR